MECITYNNLKMGSCLIFVSGGLKNFRISGKIEHLSICLSMLFDHAVSGSMITKFSSKLFVANSFVEIYYYQWCPKDGTCFHLVSTVVYTLYRRSKIYQKMQREKLYNVWKDLLFHSCLLFVWKRDEAVSDQIWLLLWKRGVFLGKDEFVHSYPIFL